MSNQEVCYQCDGILKPSDQPHPMFMNIPVCHKCGYVLEHAYAGVPDSLFTEEEIKQIRLCAQEKYLKYMKATEPFERPISTREWAEKVFGISKRTL